MKVAALLFPDTFFGRLTFSKGECRFDIFFRLIAIISEQSLSHTVFPQFALSLLCVFPLSQTVLKHHSSQVRHKSPTAVSVHEKTGCYVSRTNCLYLYLVFQSLWALLTLLRTHTVMKRSVKSISSRNKEKSSSCQGGVFCRKSFGPDTCVGGARRHTSVNQDGLSALHCTLLHCTV